MTALTVPTNGIYPYIKDPETIPERFVQLGGDRIPFSYDLGFNFAANHTGPYKNNAYKGESRITALSMTPVQASASWASRVSATSSPSCWKRTSSQ